MLLYALHEVASRSKKWVWYETMLSLPFIIIPTISFMNYYDLIVHYWRHQRRRWRWWWWRRQQQQQRLYHVIHKNTQRKAINASIFIAVPECKGRIRKKDNDNTSSYGTNGTQNEQCGGTSSVRSTEQQLHHKLEINTGSWSQSEEKWTILCINETDDWFQ